MASCGARTAADSCRVRVAVGFPEYTRACLYDADGRWLDSLQWQERKILFTRTDTAGMPYVVFVTLINPADSMDRAQMPVVIEGGDVQVEIGEYITTSGTPLNRCLQEFLNALQATHDAIRQAGVSYEDSRKSFSEFYRQQILANKDNVVGGFIFRQYGIHLNQEDASLVKAQLGN